jgi:predicted ABC-type ATPase
MTYELSEQELSRRFSDHILAGLLAADPQPQQHPRVVIVAGQPGAGKSYTERAVITDLRLDTFMSVDPDDLRPYHPDYQRLAQIDDRTVDSHTVQASRLWNTMALKHATSHRFNIVWSTPLTGLDVLDWVSLFFRNRGYRIDLAVVAVDDIRSKLGILHRYQRGRDSVGTGRMVPFDYHDRVYASLPGSLSDAETRNLVDGIHLYTRGGQPLYRNVVDDRQWQRTPAVARAFADARLRPWSKPDVAAFVSVVGWLARHPHVDPATQPHLLPEHRCTPVAADLRPLLAQIARAGAERLRTSGAAEAVDLAHPLAAPRIPLRLRRDASATPTRRHQPARLQQFNLQDHQR